MIWVYFSDWKTLKLGWRASVVISVLIKHVFVTKKHKTFFEKSK